MTTFSVSKIVSTKFSRFTVLFIALYLTFYYFTIFWIGVMAKGNWYWPYAEEHLNFIKAFRLFLLNSASEVCALFGYKATVYGQYGMRIQGGSGIRLVYSCLGYGVMSFYAAFVLAWPAASIRKKWFVLAVGLAGIVLLNIFRLAFLPIIYTRYPSAKGFPIDHHDIFNMTVYAFILAALYFWTRRLEARRN